MDNVQSLVSSILTTLTKEQLTNVIERLQECGVEDVKDLEYVEADDLSSCLKPVQIRKLLRAVTPKPETSIGESAEPGQISVEESRCSSASSYASATETVDSNHSIRKPDLITTPATSTAECDLSLLTNMCVDGVAKMVRAALGRMAKIGDLYDARCDCFTGHTLFPMSFQPPLKVLRNPSATVELLLRDSFSSRLEKLGAQDELQLSIAFGLAQAEGSSDSFVRGCSAKADAILGCLVQTTTTLIEQLDDKFYTDLLDGKSALISPDQTTRTQLKLPEADTNATHVVAGVSWGTRVIVVAEKVNALNVERKAIEQELENSLNVLARADPRALGEPWVANFDTNYVTTLYTDFDQIGTEDQTLHSACILLQNLSSFDSSTSNFNGHQLTYVMVPLSSLKRQRDDPCATAIMGYGEMTEDKSVLNQLMEVVDNMIPEKHRLQSLLRDMQEHSFCLPPEKLAQMLTFGGDLDKSFGTFCTQAAKLIVDYRSQQIDSTPLKQLVVSYMGGSFYVDSVRQSIVDNCSIAEKMAFVDAVNMQGAIYIASDAGVDTYSKNADAYILFASEEAKQLNRQVWSANCMTFFDLMKEVKDRELRQEQRRQNKHDGNSLTAFVYADCDFVTGGRDTISIRHYVNGKCLCSDVTEENALIASLDIARSSQKQQPGTFLPRQRAILSLICPGSRARCSKNHRVWSCETCRVPLEYGFDDFFYCTCGRAPFNAFSFRCSERNHDSYFIQYDVRVLSECLQKLEPLKELNVLFLGETGVGKSTFINGFANYLTYSSLDEAENGDTVDPIPASFTMMSDTFQEVVITTGTDKNEVDKPGSSATQFPKTYRFTRRDNTLVRIIDTPGIGDTRGIEYDKSNMQNILTHISNLEELNGICVLLKPNNARLTVMFSFCIKELLTHLHRDACKNIVFCFTNARGTFYRPGDTLPALRTLLKGNTDIGIQLCEETLYCIDNEAVRFLAALKNGIAFDETEKVNYRTSWDTSVRETERLINYISSLPPHQLKNTLSLNDVRRAIVSISRPVAEITSTIENNIAIVKRRRKEIMESTKDKEELSKNLFIPAVDLQTTPLPYPRTVCTSARCVRYLTVAGVKKVEHVQHCHPKCKIRGAPTDTLNCVALQRCWAMNRYPPHACHQCGCGWEKHMHITYECKQVITNVKDISVEKQISEKASAIEIVENHLQTLQTRIDQLEGEKKPIAEISAKFGCFLHKNAIAPYNDALADYLDYLIDTEKSAAVAGCDSQSLRGLEQMRRMYDEEVRILKDALRHPLRGAQALPKPEDINPLFNKLYELPVSGPMLQKAIQTAEATRTAAAQYSEMRVQTQYNFRRHARKMLRSVQNWFKPPWRYWRH